MRRAVWQSRLLVTSALCIRAKIKSVGLLTVTAKCLAQCNDAAPAQNCNHIYSLRQTGRSIYVIDTV
jgi:hypothetical protein